VFKILLVAVLFESREPWQTWALPTRCDRDHLFI
jgi:hypothetical protein